MKHKGHNPNKMIVNVPYCSKCGLMYLKNRATQIAIKKACPGDDEE